MFSSDEPSPRKQCPNLSAKGLPAPFVVIHEEGCVSSYPLPSFIATQGSTYLWKDPNEQQGITPALESKAEQPEEGHVTMEKHAKEKDTVFESVTWEAQNYDDAERKFQEVCSAQAWFT